MHSLKLLKINLTMGAVMIICQLVGIHGEHKINVLPNSYCLLEAHNETHTKSFVIENKPEIANSLAVTIYGSTNRSCDLQIDGLSSFKVAHVAGKMRGMDYIYLENIGPLKCSNRFLVFMGPLESCEVYSGNNTVQLHFRGDIAVYVHVQYIVMKEKQPPGCPEYGNQVTAGALEGQASNCKQVKEFGSVVHCVRTNHRWWVFNELGGWWEQKSKPSLGCDVQCPDNCLCMLTDRQVVYNCSQNIQDFGKISSGFLLFPSDISLLDLSKNGISTLTVMTFTNIGTDIRYLDLSSNFLTILPPGSLDYLYSIFYLDLEGNSLATLDTELFVNLHNLAFLDLQFNALVTLDVGVFAGLHSLTYLSLSDNTLVTLDVGVFASLHSLTHLYLRNNALVTLDVAVFANLHSLALLYLSINSLVTLDVGVFSKLHSLTDLFLSDNSLVTLDVGVFTNLHNLTRLSLSDNSLVTLDVGVFANLHSLTDLSLSDNSLVTLDVGVFTNLHNLTRLSLSENSLVTLDVGVFSKLHSLTDLFLSDNSLVTLDVGVFTNLHNLTRLSLSDNSLVTLDVGMFANLHSLTDLSLSHNSLVTLDVGVFTNLHNLTHLSLSGNSLVTLDVWVFANLHSLTILFLHSNSLVTLDADVFAHLHNLIELTLDSNALVTLDVGMFANLHSLTYLHLDSNSLVTLEVGVFANLRSLTELFLHYNELVTLDEGVFANLHSLTYLFLSDNTLVTLDAGVFANLYNLISLNLNQNALVTLETLIFINLHKLEYLFLEGNELVALDHMIFHELVELRYLYISKNKISHLEDGTFSNLFLLGSLSVAFNRLIFLPFNIFEDLHSLVLLDLSGNRLQKIPQIGHMTLLNKIDLSANPLTKITKNMFFGVKITSSIFVDQPEVCICYLNGSDTCFNTIKPSPYLTCNHLLSFTALTVFIWIIGCSAIFGNIFVVWWKQFKQRAENKVQSLLLSNLAMSDLLMGIYMIIIASADIHYGQYFPMNAESWRSSVLCRVAGTLAITSSEASVLFVTFISIDRCITIKFPYSIHKFGVKSTRLISALVWAFSLAFGLTASILAGRNSDFYDNSHVCIGLPLAQVIYHKTQTIEAANIVWWEDAKTVEIIESSDQSPGLYFSVAVFIAFNMFCFLLILACYIGLIRAVSKTSRQAFRQREMAEEIRMTLKVSAIVFTDFFCWFPICLMGALVQIGLIELPNSVFAWAVTFILPINSAINPFLYTIATVITDRCSRRTPNPAHNPQKSKAP